MKFEYKTQEYKRTEGWHEPDRDGKVSWKVTETAEHAFEAGANALGAEGWELVAVWPTVKGSLHATFKRPVLVPEPVVEIDCSAISDQQMEKIQSDLAKSVNDWRRPLTPGIPVTIEKVISCDCTPGTEHCGRTDCSQPFATKKYT